MNVFSNNNDHLTSKDLIERKRNITLYCDLKHNKNKNAKKIGCVKNDYLHKALNHSELTKLQHGFHDYYQHVDVSENFFTSYDGEVFKKENILPVNAKNDLSSNYTGAIMVHYENGLQEIEDSAIFFKEKFVQLDISNNATLTNNKKINKTKCFKLHTPLKIHD